MSPTRISLFSTAYGITAHEWAMTRLAFAPSEYHYRRAMELELTTYGPTAVQLDVPTHQQTLDNLGIAHTREAVAAYFAGSEEYRCAE